MPTIAAGTERMKLVIATEAECPARLIGRPGPTASMAPEAASRCAWFTDTPPGARTVQAREYLL
jgi:hypothetical protein